MLQLSSPEGGDKLNKEDLLKMIPDAERIKDSLEKNLKKNKLTVTSKNGMVTAVINYQQEITDW